METEAKPVRPTSIWDLKFGMVFQSKGEGAFLYKVNEIQTGRDPWIYMMRIHDGNYVKVTADRFFVMVRSGSLVFVK